APPLRGPALVRFHAGWAAARVAALLLSRRDVGPHSIRLFRRAGMRERSAIEIVEEAVNLLRAAPVRAFAVYLAGAVPFTLALLFFLSDMTRSPFASDHVGTASLAVAILYVWKNVWQAVFMQKLYGMLSPERAGATGLAKLVAIQGTFQPVGLVLMLPFPWLA